MPLTTRMLLANSVLPATMPTLRLLTLTVTPVLLAQEPLDSVPTAHGTAVALRTATPALVVLVPDLLSNTEAVTDTLSPLLTRTPMPLNPLRPTVMLPLRTVPAVTNSEEPRPLPPTRPDTRRTLTESGVASTAPPSDTESLAPRPMRLPPTVVAPLRTTVPELVPLASALPVRVAGELPPPAPMAATHGVAPEVTGKPPELVSRVLAPTPAHGMMDPLRATPP